MSQKTETRGRFLCLKVGCMMHKDNLELDKVIKSVIKDMNANRPVEKIAERNHIEIGLVEDILQIFTTHPGIDMDGILDRLKLYL